MYVAQLDEELQLDGFDEEPQRQYNLLQHNGAVYALALSYDCRQDQSVKEAMLQGIIYLKDQAILPVPDMELDDDSYMTNMLAPWEPEQTETADKLDKRGPNCAKLGGAGLGLIALCNVKLVVPGTSSVEYLRKIGNFITYMQKDDGSFVSCFSSEEGLDDSWNSLYYPGEAALGLLYLSELETDEVYRKKWISLATSALLYLEGLRRYKPLEDIQPDHWALLANAWLLPKLNPDSVSYWLVYNHAIRVVQSILAPHTEQELVINNGCFTDGRQTCPTATQLEGLLAAYTFVKDYKIYIDEDDYKVQPL